MLVKFFAGAVVGGLVLASGSLGYMAQDRDPPLEILERKVLTTRVRPGEDFLWAVKLIQHKRCEIHTDRFLYDSAGTRYVLPPVTFKAGIGAADTDMAYNIKVTVPPEAAFGPAKYVTSSAYRCNLLQYFFPVYGDVMRLEFEIVPL